MTIISVQIALTLIGAALFGYGVLTDTDAYRIGAIGTLAVALFLRFVRKRNG
ncbi:MAG TPA: hypothetical protein VE861_07070 [Gemmatimonadaceae bacterium]|nr:hypothetical protein [Gemmatimonadaceae bacterium]